jgi:hypothetical protein
VRDARVRDARVRDVWVRDARDAGCGMRDAGCKTASGTQERPEAVAHSALRTPHSTPLHSAHRTPHTAHRIPHYRTYQLPRSPATSITFVMRSAAWRQFVCTATCASSALPASIASMIASCSATDARMSLVSMLMYMRM